MRINQFLDTFQLEFALNLLTKARNQLDFHDYEVMFGDIAGHIWRQEGTDLIKIWDSGLSINQKTGMLNYLMKKEFK